MAYQPANISKLPALPKILRPRMIIDCDTRSNIAVGGIYCNSYYQQASYFDYIGAGMQGVANSIDCLGGNLLGGIGAAQAQIQPQPAPKPKPEKQKAHYSYELIQQIKDGAPFVVPKLSPLEPKPPEKSSTQETALAAPDLAVFG